MVINRGTEALPSLSPPTCFPVIISACLVALSTVQGVTLPLVFTWDLISESQTYIFNCLFKSPLRWLMDISKRHANAWSFCANLFLPQSSQSQKYVNLIFQLLTPKTLKLSCLWSSPFSPTPHLIFRQISLCLPSKCNLNLIYLNLSSATLLAHSFSLPNWSLCFGPHTYRPSWVYAFTVILGFTAVWSGILVDSQYVSLCNQSRLQGYSLCSHPGPTLQKGFVVNLIPCYCRPEIL